MKGEALLGLRYHPPFDHFKDAYWNEDGELRDGGREAYLWKVLSGDFVTLDSGTGLVHQAPAFGEVDYDVHKETADRYSNPSEVPLTLSGSARWHFRMMTSPRSRVSGSRKQTGY